MSEWKPVQGQCKHGIRLDDPCRACRDELATSAIEDEQSRLMFGDRGDYGRVTLRALRASDP